VRDSSGWLSRVRDWQVVLAGALAVLCAAVIIVVVRTDDTATADTYLTGVRAATVTLADGREVAASDGMRVPDGAQVRTGAGGAAQLTTAGRDVYLGALSTVVVRDGLRQQLDRGQLMVDSRGGARLVLTTRAGRADVSEGTLVRVEQGLVLRVGVFDGSTRFTPQGRLASSTIPALYQAKLVYGGPTVTSTALALTDDAWERRLAGDLVSADLDLNALARGLVGADGQVVLESVSARLREAPVAFTDRGEQALALALAQAGTRSSDATENLAIVDTARRQGGSWGVVAALVSARVSAVSGLLDRLLAPPGPTSPPLLAGPSLGPGSLLSPGSSSSGGPGPSGSGSPTSTPSPTSPVTRTPTPSPSTVVDDLVTTVTGLLGTPTPTPHITPSPGALAGTVNKLLKH
jgi:hypothetical protein